MHLDNTVDLFDMNKNQAIFYLLYLKKRLESNSRDSDLLKTHKAKLDELQEKYDVTLIFFFCANPGAGKLQKIKVHTVWPNRDVFCLRISYLQKKIY